MPASTLSSQGQLTLPKPLRDRLGLRPGDRVEFRLSADGEVIVDAATIDLRTLRGALQSRGKRVTVEEMSSTVRKAGTRL